MNMQQWWDDKGQVTTKLLKQKPVTVSDYVSRLLAVTVQK
jgi:hypothetical protein